MCIRDRPKSDVRSGGWRSSGIFPSTKGNGPPARRSSGRTIVFGLNWKRVNPFRGRISDAVSDVAQDFRNLATEEDEGEDQCILGQTLTTRGRQCSRQEGQDPIQRVHGFVSVIRLGQILVR